MATANTHWRIPPGGWVAIAIAIVAEATSNALRGYHLGAYLEAFTVDVASIHLSISGAVLVMAAIAISLSQARAIWVAFMPGLRQQRIVGGCVGVLLLAVSVTAMATTILEAQRAKTSEEGGTRGKYGRAESDYNNANTEYSNLVAANIRSVGQVTAAIAAARAKVSSKIIEYTGDCGKLEGDLAQFRKSCQPLLDLHTELASAVRKAELEAKLPDLKKEADGLKPTQKAGQAEESVIGFWGWIMGFAVVFVATFGPVIFATVEQPSPSGQPSATAAQPTPAETAQTSFATDGATVAAPFFTPDPPPGPRGNRRKRKPSKTATVAAKATVAPSATVYQFPVSRPTGISELGAQAWLREHLERNGFLPDQDTMATELKMGPTGKGTVSRWLKRWEADGIIVRQQSGRCKVVRMAPTELATG